MHQTQFSEKNPIRRIFPNLVTYLKLDWTSLPASLKCNTQKHLTRIKHKTAGNVDTHDPYLFLNNIHYCQPKGVLLGAWPCGTINMVGELHGAESKTQVYGQLHNFLSRNKEATQHLGI